MSNTKVVVVGCSHWGKNLVRNFTELGALSIVCDENEMLAKSLAAEYKVIHKSFRLNLGKFFHEENMLWGFALHDIPMILSLAGDSRETVYATRAYHLSPRIHDVITPQGSRYQITDGNLMEIKTNDRASKKSYEKGHLCSL